MAGSVCTNEASPVGSCTNGCPLLNPTEECHCTTCGEHFSTAGNFDKHRVNGKCRKPEKSGLVLSTDRRKGARVWTGPSKPTELSVGASRALEVA